MIVNAWNNGAQSRNGLGYGFRVHPADRDAYFQKEWTSIVLEVEGQGEAVEVNLVGLGLWEATPAAISCPALGRWLRHNGLAPWVRGQAPTFVLEPIGENRFRVEKADKRHGS